MADTTIGALGSNPADRPISCLYLPSQAHRDSTAPLSQGLLGDTGALRVSQHQGVYWRVLLYSIVARRWPRTHKFIRSTRNTPSTIRLQVDTEQRVCGITMTPPLSLILIRKDT